ncbi:hypothetical protein TNCV_828481 [Trichonephila clavipes]|nr:hypothetical protein TNCV_828481 [Trichonephila clavipes]
MTFDNVFWKGAFTGIASNTNAAIVVPQIKAGFVRKNSLLPISPPGSVFMTPLPTQLSMVFIVAVWIKERRNLQLQILGNYGPDLVVVFLPTRSDEVHFWLNGYVIKQNCRIWSEANPQMYVETPLHPEKLTVWCVLWAGGILLQKR